MSIERDEGQSTYLPHDDQFLFEQYLKWHATLDRVCNAATLKDHHEAEHRLSTARAVTLEGILLQLSYGADELQSVPLPIATAITNLTRLVMVERARSLCELRVPTA